MLLPHDPLWPRAASLFSRDNADGSDLALLGVPASQTSISPSGAHNTPAAIRSALARYSLAHSSPDVDLSKLRLHDIGDVTNPDIDENKCVQ